MRGPTAGISDDGSRMLEIELSDGRWQKIFGDNYCVFDVIEVRRTLAAQRFENSVDHIFNIRSSFAQIFILDFGVDGQQTITDYLYSPFSVSTLANYVGLDFVAELAILEHQQMRVKDIGVVLAQELCGSFFDYQQLLSGLIDGLPEAV